MLVMVAIQWVIFSLGWSSMIKQFESNFATLCYKLCWFFPSLSKMDHSFLKFAVDSENSYPGLLYWHQESINSMFYFALSPATNKQTLKNKTFSRVLINLVDILQQDGLPENCSWQWALILPIVLASGVNKLHIWLCIISFNKHTNKQTNRTN